MNVAGVKGLRRRDASTTVVASLIGLILVCLILTLASWRPTGGGRGVPDVAAVSAAVGLVAGGICWRLFWLIRRSTALFREGIALVASGEVAAAEQRYRSAMAIGVRQVWSSSALNLGVLRHTAGDLPEAQALFESVIRHAKHHLTRRKASWNLGTVHAAQTDPRAAQSAYWWALETPDRDLQFLSILGLVDTLSPTEHQPEIAELLARAISMQMAEEMPLAVIGLGRRAQAAGHNVAAHSLLQQVVICGPGVPRATARVFRAHLFLTVDDQMAATEQCHLVPEAAWDQVPEATLLVAGYVLLRIGEQVRGLACWRRATSSADVRIRVKASSDMGEELLRLNNDVDAARPLLQLAVAQAADHPDLLESAAVATASLGYIATVDGDLDRAHQLWDQAITSGFPAAASMAQVYQARQSIIYGDIAEATELLQAASAAGPPEVASDAEHTLASLTGRPDLSR